MSNITEKKIIKGYHCTVNWFCVGKCDTLTIEITGFDKVKGATTDRAYVEKVLGIVEEAKE